MQKPKRLLVISNGHGEDEVAVRLLRFLLRLRPELRVVALPIVGWGQCYKSVTIPLLLAGQTLPSGGFLKRAFGQDLQAGLLRLTNRQLRALKQWSQSGGIILAVGDIVPLSMAWWSGLPYAFVGTAKSEYYRGRHPSHLRSSIYWPWERWLMAQDRCRGVFPRDRVTTTTLKRWPIRVFDCGNPMMDDLEPQGHLSQLPPGLRILLLPGSHTPEVFANWQLMIAAIAGLLQTQQRYVFLGAIAPGIDLRPLHQTLREGGWINRENSTFVSCQQHQNSLLLVPNGFRDCLHAATIVLAMAGTATEQAVGLGKPVITMPGLGPQFTAQFATDQAQLLGPSIYLIKGPADLPPMLSIVREQCSQPQAWIDNGRCRMGLVGASAKIAQTLQKCLLDT